jgi:DNA-binding NarL/FixJ family response regulator
LSTQPGWIVCAEAKCGAEALEFFNRFQPDIVVMDLNMPGMNGVDALRAIKSRSPEVGIVVLTLHYSEQLVRELIKAGARGYVSKSDADRDLVNAVSAVAAGKTYFTIRSGGAPELGSLPPAEETAAPWNGLSNREREAVRSIAQTMRKLL